MIIAHAGRRIDAAEANPPRFPLKNVELVRQRVRAMFKSHAAVALVSAAACGADLIALSEAGALGLRRRVVLPFERKRFRETSVIDRPGDWGPLYDEVLDEVEDDENVVIVSKATSDEEAFSAANAAILDEAVILGRQLHLAACAALVWDGVSRGEHDVTEEFGAEARKRGLTVVEVKTI